jgi:hypothetical protein
MKDWEKSVQVTRAYGTQNHARDAGRNGNTRDPTDGLGRELKWASWTE